MAAGERTTPLTDPREIHARREEVQIVDVREDVEWLEGHIEGSLHLPLAEILSGRTDALADDRPIVAVCRSGNRSEVAAMMLGARGLEASNMEGGLEAWVAAELPLTPGSGDSRF